MVRLAGCLTLATEFECYCRGVAVLLGIRSAASSNSALSIEELNQFGAEILSRQLNRNMNAIFRDSEPGREDLVSVFDDAREARNRVAHDITKGSRGDIETADGRANLLEILQNETAIIARANFLIASLAAVAYEEDPPRSSLLEDYSVAAQSWVVEML